MSDEDVGTETSEPMDANINASIEQFIGPLYVDEIEGSLDDLKLTSTSSLDFS